MRKLGWLLFAGVLVACSGPQGDDGTDGGADARTDARADARADGAADGSHDGSTDAGHDGATDAGSDASADAAHDAATEAGVDAAADVGPDAVAEGGVDAAPEAGMDAGVDAGPEAGTDAGADARADAATDAGADAAPTDAGSDASTCTPTTETCNGVDDDCDGQIDEGPCGTHLLITEVVNTPSEAEFVEIYNPTSAAIDLTSYLISDNALYAQFVAATPPAISMLPASDFIARFPAGAMIPAGGYVTIATTLLTTATQTFPTYYGGTCPTYYLPHGTAANPCPSSVAMLPLSATLATIGSSAGLTNGGEPVILFRWDGASDLVQDVDYVYYGTPSSSNAQVNKTGLTVDGPDSDTTAAPYLPDTAPASQQTTPAAVGGASNVRCNYTEGTETHSGGNGIGGHDETSEPVASTFRSTTSSGGSPITSVNGSPGAENNCR